MNDALEPWKSSNFPCQGASCDRGMERLDLKRSVWTSSATKNASRCTSDLGVFRVGCVFSLGIPKTERFLLRNSLYPLPPAPKTGYHQKKREPHFFGSLQVPPQRCAGLRHLFNDTFLDMRSGQLLSSAAEPLKQSGHGQCSHGLPGCQGPHKSSSNGLATPGRVACRTLLGLHCGSRDNGNCSGKPCEMCFA